MPYETKRIPLYFPAANRAASVLKDARLVNCWVEKDAEGRIWVQKRPALVQQAQPAGVVAGHGIFAWNSAVYGVFGSRFYAGALGQAPIDVGPVENAGVYHFSSTLGAVRKLFFHNSGNAYTYSATDGLEEVSDADFPLEVSDSPLAAGTVYLNGTTYVARREGATIFGSEPNEPASWAPDNFILAQIEPDSIQFLMKHLVYVIAGKEWTTEVFHNDPNNAVGSPLAADQGLKMNFGCLAPQSVQDVGGDLMWMSTTREGSAAVVFLSNLRAQIVSTPAIERQLEDAGAVNTATSWSGKVGGHRLYAITLLTRTLVYDITIGVWYEWTSPAGGPLPIIASTLDPDTHKTLLQDVASGDLYTLEMDTYVDDDGAFPVDIYTPNWDGETRVRKHMSRLELIGDQAIGDVCYIRHSDDDYASWSAYRVVDRGVKRQLLFNLGTFYRRAFNVRHFSDAPFRVQALEGLVALGSL